MLTVFRARSKGLPALGPVRAALDRERAGEAEPVSSILDSHYKSKNLNLLNYNVHFIY